MRENEMINQRILTYEDIAPIRIGTSLQPMVGVCEYDSTIIAEYQKYDMAPYTGSEILVRETVARKLARANAFLNRQYGYRIKVVYGYRHPAIQMRYFKERRNVLAVSNPGMDDTQLDRLTHSFVAIPEIAGHPVGGAVDVTMVDVDGSECDMGTGIADYSDPNNIQTFSASASETQQKNRLILLEAMTTQEFAPFYGEWWHFSYGDREWAAFYGKRGALYGAVETSTK